MRNRFTLRQQVVASAVAYLFALNALLVAWIAAPISAQAAFNPLSIACLTSTPDGKPAKTPIEHTFACHCATACGSAGCCASGALAATDMVPPPADAMAVIGSVHTEHARVPVLSGPHSARGPPISD